MEITDPAKIQDMLHLLSDDYSRKIMLGAISGPKSVEELSRENDIPLSTCYRRIHELIDEGFIILERIVVTPDGKRYEMLRSTYKGFSVVFQDGTFRLDATINGDIADKLHAMWISMKRPVVSRENDPAQLKSEKKNLGVSVIWRSSLMF